MLAHQPTSHLTEIVMQMEEVPKSVIWPTFCLFFPSLSALSHPLFFFLCMTSPLATALESLSLCFLVARLLQQVVDAD